MKRDPPNPMITVEKAAKGYKVLPRDVLEWIEAGKIQAVKQNDDSYLIPLEEYQRFGRSLPKELREKVGQYLWEAMESTEPMVRADLRDTIKQNIQFVLNRAEQAVSLLEELHKKYEPRVDVFNDKRGSTACFIIFARIISMLYSIIALLRSGVPAESFILFRPLHEAVLLAEYFMFSEADNENQNEIKKWFENDQSPSASKVREYHSKKFGMPIDSLRQLHKGYSKPIHHTYKVIMESYRGYSMSGFLGNYQKRLGFDYHQSSIMMDIVDLIGLFEELLLEALLGFYKCFSLGIPPLSDEESKKLKKEIDFYGTDPITRVKSIFGRK